MEGFKANPKMRSQLACFKEGGFVTKKQLVAYEKKEDKAEEKSDTAKDKKIAKKAISQHESAQHRGEPKTELKLKTGRRVKKTGGVVNKFKKGGAVNAAERGKPSGDKDPIKKIKPTTKKASAPSKAKIKKPEVPGSEMGPSGAMDPLTAPPPTGPAAAAPSPAMVMPADGVQNMASGRRPFFNEEPDDMTAVPRKTRPRTKKAPLAGQGAVSDVERQQMMDMFQGGPGAVSDYERQMMQPSAGAASDYEREQIQGYAPGGMIPDAVTRAGIGGLGNAINTGPLGAAGSMGAPRNTPLSPQEQDIMRGLQAVGGYCSGGKAY